MIYDAEVATGEASIHPGRRHPADHDVLLTCAEASPGTPGTYVQKSAFHGPATRIIWVAPDALLARRQIGLARRDPGRVQDGRAPRQRGSGIWPPALGSAARQSGTHQQLRRRQSPPPVWNLVSGARQIAAGRAWSPSDTRSARHGKIHLDCLGCSTAARRRGGDTGGCHPSTRPGRGGTSRWAWGRSPASYRSEQTALHTTTTHFLQLQHGGSIRQNRTRGARNRAA